MLKIGLFTFGGGYAMIALLENEFVTKQGWVDKEEFLDMAAIAESTPGPIAINGATYIGYRLRGIMGSLLATVAICIPAFTIIYIISLFFDRFLSFTLIAKAFSGIRVCVIYLIGSAGLRLLSGIPKKPFPLAILIGAAAAMIIASLLTKSLSTLVLILLSGLLGLAAYGISSIRTHKSKGGENT